MSDDAARYGDISTRGVYPTTLVSDLAAEQYCMLYVPQFGFSRSQNILTSSATSSRSTHKRDFLAFLALLSALLRLLDLEADTFHIAN